MEKENPKDVIYYENILKMWIDNRMILTKSIFNISAGGIGILITFIGNFKLQTFPQKFTFILALLFLIITLGICLCIYLFNTKHLEKVFNEKEESSITLGILFTSSAITLILALSFAGYMTYLSIFNNDKNKEKIYRKINNQQQIGDYSMTKDKKPIVTKFVTNSANGISKMRTTSVSSIKGTADGIARMRPTQSSGNSDGNTGGKSKDK